MKIVLTVHQFFPRYRAGTEVLTLETAKQLQHLGHEVCIFAGFPLPQELTDEDKFDECTYEGINVRWFRYPIVPTAAGATVAEDEYRNRAAALSFHDLLRTVDPDIVHFFHLKGLSGSLIEICHNSGFPMLLTTTDFWFVCPTIELRLPDGCMCSGPQWNAANCVKHMVALNRLHGLASEFSDSIGTAPNWALGLEIRANQLGILRSKWFNCEVEALSLRHDYLRKQINRISRVLVPTRLMERVLTTNGLERSRVVFAPYGINLTHIQPHSRLPSSGVLRVGFIGTLSEHKGADILLKAVRSLPRTASIEVKVFGRAEDFPAYFDHLSTLAKGDQRIQMCGTFPNSAIGSILSSLDVLVVPSIWYENTPLVIYSAQAAGCPVIASNLAGMSEVIRHEENGLLFRVGDIAELTQALQRLCSDRPFLEYLSKRAIMPRSINEYVRQIEAIYEDVLSGLPSET